MKNLIYKI